MPQRIEMWRPPRATYKIRRRETRPNAAARGYCDARHKAWRIAVLNRDNWQCQACGRVCGRKREAHADHIIPVAERPDLRYEVANGRCLCDSCHSRRTSSDRACARISTRET
jgi:5-methylcytosine-specific restriction endonuclease McrA